LTYGCHRVPGDFCHDHGDIVGVKIVTGALKWHQSRKGCGSGYCLPMGGINRYVSVPMKHKHRLPDFAYPSVPW
jgi:hypothetical protein